MKTVKLNLENSIIYIGNSYKDCLKEFVNDIQNYSDGAIICELEHCAPVKDIPGTVYIERIFDPKKELMRDHYKYSVKYAKEHSKDKDYIFENTKTTIDEDILDKWCKNCINDQTRQMYCSSIIYFNLKYSRFIKCDINVAYVNNCDNSKSNLIAIECKKTKVI